MDGVLRKAWPYATVLCALAAALFIAIEPHMARDLWQRGEAYAATHWRKLLFGSGGRMVLMLVGLMVLEVFFLEWRRTSVFGLFVRRSASAKTDAAWTLLYFTHLQVFVETALTLGAAFGLATVIGGAYNYLGWQRLEIPLQGPLGLAATFAVFYLLSTFGSYWTHRLQHWRFFWHLHRYHHAATELNVLTGFRSNPVESLVNALSLPLPLILMRVDDWAILALVMTYQAVAVLQHSELQWNFGWIGRWVIVSPQMHQVHHSIDPEHQDKNFSVCPLWDHMFGTWYGGPNLPSGYGLVDRAHLERPVMQWLLDVWAFYRDAALWLTGRAGFGRRGTAASAATEASAPNS